jgi:uncharacterized protein YceK
MKRYIPARILMTWLIASSLQGCATYSTISEAKPGSPKIYSGTRLDWNAMQSRAYSQSKFKVEPPQKPLLDLPFSMLFDTVMLPLTFSISGYEALFGSDE